AQLIEGDGAKAGVGYVGRDRGGAVCRPDGTRDETWTAILRLRQIGRRARQRGTLAVQLVHDARHAVIRLGNARRGEGVGGGDVGAGPVVGEMDVADLGRLAQDEKIVVAPHLAV